MIIPSRWFAGGKGLDEFRESMLADDRLRSIDDYLSASDVFPGVGLKGAVLRCAYPGGAFAFLLVPAKRGGLSRHAQPAGEETEPVLPRLQGHSGGGERRRNRRGGLVPGAGCDGRSAHHEDHHPVLRQVDHGRDGKAVDGDSHAPQLIHPGDVLSSRVPGAIALDSTQPRRRVPEYGAGHQGRMLRLRFRPGPSLTADCRLQLPVECQRNEPGNEGRRVHQLPARAGLRWQFHEADSPAHRKARRS